MKKHILSQGSLTKPSGIVKIYGFGLSLLNGISKWSAGRGFGFAVSGLRRCFSRREQFCRRLLRRSRYCVQQSLSIWFFITHGLFASYRTLPPPQVVLRTAKSINMILYYARLVAI